MAGGRPSKYQPEIAEQAYKLCLLGATDKEMADFFGVSEVTFNAWKKEYPEFLKSIKRGKIIADANVAERLYTRATGYEQKTDKIFQFQGEPVIVPTIEHIPPDTGAAIFWLKNRKKDQWRDKQDMDLNIKEMPEIIIKRSE